MSKEFEGIFADDPERKATVEEERKRVQKQEDKEELAQRREKNLQAEINKYGPLIVEVLEKLRQAAYPASQLKEGSWDYGKNFRRDEYWQIGSIGTKAVGLMGTGKMAVWNTDISVGLIINEEGIATAFGCSHQRSVGCDLTFESLVEALLTLHKPEPANRRLSLYYGEIVRALIDILESPYLLKDHEYKRNFYASEPKEYSYQDLGPLPHRREDGVVYESVIIKVDSCPDISDEIRVSVQLLVDENYTPTFYRCNVDGASVDIPVDTNLLRFLENLLKKQATQREQAARQAAFEKTALGKLSKLVRRNRK